MAVTEKYQANVFAIIVLLVAVLITAYLIVAAIYYNSLVNLRPPSRGESTFMFWTTIVLIVIFAAIIIYSIYLIFTHKAIVFEKQKPKEVVATTTSNVPTRKNVLMPAAAPTYSTISNVKVNNAPARTYSMNDAIPLNANQSSYLQNELISLGDF